MWCLRNDVQVPLTLTFLAWLSNLIAFQRKQQSSIGVASTIKRKLERNFTDWSTNGTLLAIQFRYILTTTFRYELVQKNCQIRAAIQDVEQQLGLSAGDPLPPDIEMPDARTEKMDVMDIEKKDEVAPKKGQRQARVSGAERVKSVEAGDDLLPKATTMAATVAEAQVFLKRNADKNEQKNTQERAVEEKKADEARKSGNVETRNQAATLKGQEELPKATTMAATVADAQAFLEREADNAGQKKATRADERKETTANESSAQENCGEKKETAENQEAEDMDEDDAESSISDDRVEELVKQNKKLTVKVLRVRPRRVAAAGTI